MTTATKTKIQTTTHEIFSHDPIGTVAELSKMRRKGVVSATIEQRGDDRQIVVVICKAGTEAEGYAAALQRHGDLLEQVGTAIRAGTAYLDTFVGRRKVVSFNDRTLNAVTLNDGEDRFFSQRTFIVCAYRIKF